MKKLHLLTGCIALLICLSSNLYADFVNGVLTLSEPDGEFFEPGDTVIATLALTDQNGNELRVVRGNDTTLRGVLCWVSGPRQHFLTTQPYERFRIRTHNEGFNENSGFDLETGEMTIVLPNELPDEGTYTVLFECNRLYNGRWYSLYLMADFQVEDIKPTITKSYVYLTCNVQGCHQNVGQHGTTDLTSCVVCHTHDYAAPWHRIEHNRRAHQNHDINQCSDCHRANADINNFSEIACYSCHDEPNDHREYVDEDCLPCHRAGENEGVYRMHDEPVPHQPDNFELIMPEDDEVVNNDTILFAWDESDDDDQDDILTYEFQLADNNRMRDRIEISTEDSTSIWIEGGLENNTDYWWRVKVTDLNTGYIYSDSRFKFTTDFPIPPEPPSPFGLIYPTIEDTIPIDGEGQFITDFVWQRSIDPNVEDSVTYDLTLNDSGRFGDEPLEAVFRELQDTLLANVNILETFGVHDSLVNWDEPWVCYWNVIAISNEDTVQCDSSFAFLIGSTEFLPPSRFALIEPLMNDTILMNDEGLFITDFSWRQSTDMNMEDSVTYSLILSDNGRFGDEQVVIIDTLQDTLLSNIEITELLGIPDSLIRWEEPWAVDWDVIAISNDDSTKCDSTFRFYMGSTEPYLPSPFRLLEPMDGDTVGLDGNYAVDFMWESSIDPNGDEVSYILDLVIRYPEMEDPRRSYEGLADTVFHYNFADSIEAEFWEDDWRIDWFVRAVAGGDRVMCDSIFTFILSSSDTLHGVDLFASLSLSEPDGDFFEPGDSVIANLYLTDAEGDTLEIDDPRNSQLVTVELWVSGPRQDYNLVQPYEMYSIVDPRGFHPESRFNPETGQIAIAIPDTLEMSGSYTVLFKCIRRVNGILHSQFPSEDFLLSQPTPTRTESFRYITCNGDGCHDDGFRDHGTHASVDLPDCIVCHTHDFELPWNGFIHNLRCHDEDAPEQFDMATTCHLCHLANAGIDHYNNTACFSCHNIEDAPLHDTYSDEECAECHNEEHTVYENHEEFEPTVPDSFDLLSPEDDTIVEEWPITLSWDMTVDHDPGDIIIYELQLSPDDQFERVATFEVGDTNHFELDNVLPDTTYWWRIRAVDLNSEGTISTQTWRYHNLAADIDRQHEDIPMEFSVSSAFPNPFNSTTGLTFELPRISDIKVTVHDVAGRQVARLAHGRFRSGQHILNWNASRMPSGIYVIKCEADGKALAMRKVLLIR